MHSVTIELIDGEPGFILPESVRARPGVQAGDTLYCVFEAGGLRLTTRDPGGAAGPEGTGAAG